jgi:hypothetical protein
MGNSVPSKGEMSRFALWQVVLVLALSGCGTSDTAVDLFPGVGLRMDGITIHARLHQPIDSVAVEVILHNAGPDSEEVLLAPCGVKLVAYHSGKTDSEPVWDEREGRPCFDGGIPIRIAPGQAKRLAHAVSESALDGKGRCFPTGRLYLVAWVYVAGGVPVEIGEMQIR